MAWSDLPKPQRLGILIAVPVVLAGVFIYLTRGEMAKLGPYDGVPKVMHNLVPKRASGNLAATISATKVSIAKFEAEARKIPGLKAEIEKMKLRELVLRERLPSAKDKTYIRVMIQEFAKDLRAEENSALGRVLFDELNIDERAPKASRGRRSSGPGVEEVVYKVKLKADMNGLIYYINRVENFSRFMAITKIDLKPGKAEVDEDAVNHLDLAYKLHDVSLDIKTYVYPEDAK